MGRAMAARLGADLTPVTAPVGLLEELHDRLVLVEPVGTHNLELLLQRLAGFLRHASNHGGFYLFGGFGHEGYSIWTASWDAASATACRQRLRPDTQLLTCVQPARGGMLLAGYGQARVGLMG